jgi:DNA uptake protein ComE-like DNA-binding protein
MQKDFMKIRFISTVFITAITVLGACESFAADSNADAPKGAASQPKASTKIAPASNSAVAAKAKVAAKSDAATKVKLVDINSAPATELKTLPGIGDAEAAKIIAGRPYGSKAWLVTKGILPEAKFPAISPLVVANQPFKDATKNAAIYKKQK